MKAGNPVGPQARQGALQTTCFGPRPRVGKGEGEEKESRSRRLGAAEQPAARRRNGGRGEEGREGWRRQLAKRTGLL